MNDWAAEDNSSEYSDYTSDQDQEDVVNYPQYVDDVLMDLNSRAQLNKKRWFNLIAQHEKMALEDDNQSKPRIGRRTIKPRKFEKFIDVSNKTKEKHIKHKAAFRATKPAKLNEVEPESVEENLTPSTLTRCPRKCKTKTIDKSLAVLRDHNVSPKKNKKEDNNLISRCKLPSPVDTHSNKFNRLMVKIERLHVKAQLPSNHTIIKPARQSPTEKYSSLKHVTKENRKQTRMVKNSSEERTAKQVLVSSTYQKIRCQENRIIKKIVELHVRAQIRESHTQDYISTRRNDSLILKWLEQLEKMPDKVNGIRKLHIDEDTTLIELQPEPLQKLLNINLSVVLNAKDKIENELKCQFGLSILKACKYIEEKDENSINKYALWTNAMQKNQNELENTIPTDILNQYVRYYRGIYLLGKHNVVVSKSCR